MNYIEAPEIYTWNSQTLFLAWWISNCPDWQKEFIQYFKQTSLTIINPRRYDFDVADTSMEEEQIKWEHEHLEKSDIISFWFPKETLCPITLYELGKYAKSQKDIFVWVEDNYSRKRDVEIQMWLLRPNMQICSSLDMLAQNILSHLN